jgi:hypothetical protein
MSLLRGYEKEKGIANKIIATTREVNRIIARKREYTLMPRERREEDTKNQELLLTI